MFAEVKEYVEDETLGAWLSNHEHHNRTQNHEDEDGVEENSLEVAVILQNRQRNPIVAYYSVVHKQDANNQYLDCDAESSYFNHSYLHYVKCPLQRLDRRHQRVDIYLAQMQRD